MSDLGKLNDLKNREALLLVEVTAWLHDWRKCSDEHLKVMTRTFFNEGLNNNQVLLRQRCPNVKISEIETAQGLQRSSLNSFFPSISSLEIDINGFYISVADLVNGFRGNEDIQLPYLVLAARVAHHRAHFEKEKKDKEYDGSQCWPCVYGSSAFGYEQELALDLTKQLQTGSKIAKPFTFREDMKDAWKRALADTRRPINEVRLEDWAVAVASLYKAEMARYIINGYVRKPNDISWRLLSVSTNGFEWSFASPRIPDIQARQEILRDALNRVQLALENDYPLGLEVYRDENRSIFVVADIPNLDSAFVDAKLKKTLRQYILEQFAQGTIQKIPKWAIAKEVLPDIYIDLYPWKGQPIPQELPPIAKNWKNLSEKGHLGRDVKAAADPYFVDDAWELQYEVCTACGLRPQGYGAHDWSEHYRRKALKRECLKDCQTCKAIKRGVCSICEQRRSDRSKKWATENLNKTIWIDEVADINARLALVVGLFDLDHWLSGELVRTLAVRDPDKATKKEADEVAKSPSFARMHRIWETTRGFWQEICPTEESKNLQESIVSHALGLGGPRLEIRGTLRQKDGDETPGPYHAYDLILSRGIKLSVAWNPEKNKRDHPKGRFISIDNLAYFASLAGISAPSIDKDECKNDYSMRLHKWGAEKSKEIIQGTLTIEESTGYGGKAKEWGKINVESVEIIPESQYPPSIPILAEPRTFMALVPADRALDVVKEIKDKYEREMGKVRNRMPLHLGIVYSHRRTPLRAILDAGQRMLDQKHQGNVGSWIVKDDVTEQSGPLPDKSKYLLEGSRQFAKWYPVSLKHQEMNREIVWYIPAVMGDGTTPDNWYPYVFWIQDKGGNTEPAKATVARSRYFQSPNPWNKETSSKLGWIVHAGELKKGDSVFFTPATLDFQWLDSAGRRFEIAYDEQGQRRGLPRRPYLLDELETLNEIWQALRNHLTKNQIYILRDLIEAKRVDWQIDDQRPFNDSVFKEFCREALVNAEWKNDDLPWKAEGKDFEKCLAQWVDYTARGWLSDVVELHFQIMKEEFRNEF